MSFCSIPNNVSSNLSQNRQYQNCDPNMKNLINSSKNVPTLSKNGTNKNYKYEKIEYVKMKEKQNRKKFSTYKHFEDPVNQMYRGIKVHSTQYVNDTQYVKVNNEDTKIVPKYQNLINSIENDQKENQQDQANIISKNSVTSSHKQDEFSQESCHLKQLSSKKVLPPNWVLKKVLSEKLFFKEVKRTNPQTVDHYLEDI